MVELIPGRKYKITKLAPNELYYDLLHQIGVFSDSENSSCSFRFNGKYRTLEDGFEVEELPPPEAEAYTMPEIHEAAGFPDFHNITHQVVYSEPMTVKVTGEDADTVTLQVPRQFESGAVRDSNIGKPRPDLISPYFLESLGNVLAKGAIKYGDRNWEKGMPQETFKESAARHYVAWMMNKEDEDHAAQLAFNIMAWIHFRDKDNAKS